MEQNEIRKLLQNVANGDILVDDALLHIKNEPFEDLGYAKPDFHRKSRQGVSEVIYGAGKTAEQIIGISKSFAISRCIKDICLFAASKKFFISSVIG